MEKLGEVAEGKRERERGCFLHAIERRGKQME